jgi:hypothetical protein
MKTKAVVLAVFLLGLLALAAAAQTPVIRGPKPSKAITISGSGNQVVILRGDLEAPKAAAMASRANIFVSGRSTLAPGQVVFLGPTSPATSTATDTVVVSPRARAAASPLSATIRQQVFPGDLVRATPGPGGLTDQTGGFIIGVNGFPIPVTAAAQSAPELAIGPNGFPTLGSPTATTPIDTNGFPAPTGAAFQQTIPTTAGSATTIVVPRSARTPAGAATAPTRGAAGSATTMAASPR